MEGTLVGAVLLYAVLQDGFPTSSTDMYVDSVHADVARKEEINFGVHFPASDL